MIETSLLRADETAKARGVSRSQLYVDIREERMTPPLPPRPGRQASVWPQYEVDALNAAEIRGAADEEIRALVRQLVQERAARGTRKSTANAA